MNTTNKILTGVLIIILLSIAVFILILKFHPLGNGLQGNNIPVTQIRELSSFDKIEVETGIRVLYSQDSIRLIKVKTDSNLINLVKTEVIDSKLKIYLKHAISSRGIIEVSIANGKLNDLKLKSGSEFSTLNSITSDFLNIAGISGTKMDIKGNFGKVNATLAAGSELTIKGSCRDFTFKGIAGSVLNAGDFVVINCSLDANSGCIAKVYVKGEFNVSADAGSVIKYKGNPQLKNFDLGGGAEFIKEK